MALLKKWIALLPAAALLTAAACNGGATVPSAAGGAAGSQLVPSSANVASPSDTTSILKKLTKTVVIGTTTDPTNGDTGGHSIAITQTDYGFKKGQLLVCNFADKSGAAGKGSTIDLFSPVKGSKPKTVVKDSRIEGCDGSAVSYGNAVYGAGMNGGVVAGYTSGGKFIKQYGSPLKAPFADVDAACPPNKPHCLYNAEYIFASDAKTGGLVSFSINYYGNPTPTQIAGGFAVNNKTGWSTLGPSGLAYTYAKDTIYIADGVDNTVVAFNHASELLVKDEIVVQKGGKTFKCKYPKTTCGKLVKAGSPLDAPEAMTVLPNGNLIVANTGNNALVELTPSGQVLDTKVIDKGKSPAIFGLAAAGTNDNNTVLFYTDINSNQLVELEQ